MPGIMVSKRAQELENYKVEAKSGGIALDKNEMPWGASCKLQSDVFRSLGTMELNRYPDNDCTVLKSALSGYTRIDTSGITIGNGSDELISMVFQAFTDPGDVIAVHSPTFSMYRTYGGLCGARIWEYKPAKPHEMKLEDYISAAVTENAKLAVVCSPNNPTGVRFQIAELEEALRRFGGILLVDEAYFEFSDCTAAGLLARYNNLVILRTFSKAMGMAGLRVGYALSDPAAAIYIERVRPPFNVNVFAQAAAVEVLRNIDTVGERVRLIKQERTRLYERLKKLPGINCHESWGNFLLFDSKHTASIYKGLAEAGIHVKSFSNPLLAGSLRITIGSPEENDLLYMRIKEVLYDGA